MTLPKMCISCVHLFKSQTSVVSESLHWWKLVYYEVSTSLEVTGDWFWGTSMSSLTFPLLQGKHIFLVVVGDLVLLPISSVVLEDWLILLPSAFLSLELVLAQSFSRLLVQLIHLVLHVLQNVGLHCKSVICCSLLHSVSDTMVVVIKSLVHTDSSYTD